MFRLLPRGFTNRDLRPHLAPQLGLAPDTMTSAQITYDLRRLRLHGLIDRLPNTHPYQVPDNGLRHALFLTRAHIRLLRTGLAEIHGLPVPTKLRTATTAYENAITDLTRAAALAHDRTVKLDSILPASPAPASLAHLPSGRFMANAAWLALAVIAHNLGRAVGALAGQPRTTIATLRRRLFTTPGRLVHSARRLHLRLPSRWPWAAGFAAALGAITALPGPG